MSFGLFIEADYLVPWFLGKNYNECIIIVKIFSILIILVGLDNTIGKQCLMATNNQKKFNIGVICGAIINFISNIILIPKYDAVGAAIASVIAEFVILCIFIYYSKSLLNIKKMMFNIAKYTLFSIVMSVTSLSIIKHINTSYVNSMAIILFSSIFTYILLLLITKDKMLNETIKNILKKFKIKSK